MLKLKLVMDFIRVVLIILDQLNSCHVFKSVNFLHIQTYNMAD